MRGAAASSQSGEPFVFGEVLEIFSERFDGCFRSKRAWCSASGRCRHSLLDPSPLALALPNCCGLRLDLGVF
jgi:hypothetical protein